MKIKITRTDRPEDLSRVQPDFIYNRFDLFRPPVKHYAVTIEAGDSNRVVQYMIADRRAELGLWLTPISREEVEALLFYIKKTHPEVEKISWKNSLVSYGNAKAHNHYRIEFPATVEELESRVTTHSRYKMRKKARFAARDYGEMQILEYTRDNLPDEIVEAFFDFKRAVRSREYELTAGEYLDRYHVSDCYVVKFGDTIGAIRFACEQCPVVYGENFAYNPALRDYSLGRYIFYHHLVRMVEKGKSQLFFAGGDYEYKTHYGSIEETLYDCSVWTHELIDKWNIPARGRRWLKNHLPKGLVEKLRGMKGNK